MYCPTTQLFFWDAEKETAVILPGFENETKKTWYTYKPDGTYVDAAKADNFVYVRLPGEPAPTPAQLRQMYEAKSEAGEK